MHIFKKSLIVAGLISLVSIAHASDMPKYQVGVGYGLLNGVELAGAYNVNDYFSIRGAYSFGMDVSGSEKSGQERINYNYKLKMQHNHIGVAYHPFGGGFYVKAGYHLSDSKATAQANGVTSLNGVSSNDSNTYVKQSISLDNGLMATIGYTSRTGGLGFGVEVGGYQSSASATSTTNSTDAGFVAMVNAENDKLKKDILGGSDLIVPILQAQVSYSF